MSNRQERKEIRERRKLIQKYLIIFIIGLLSLSLIYKVGQNVVLVFDKYHQETAVLQYGCLEDRLKGDGVVLRSEKTFLAPADGHFENVVVQQEKVRRGDLLGYYISAGSKTSLRTAEAGIFTQHLDGLESALKDVKIKSASPEMFDYKIQSNDPGEETKAGQGICKVVNNLIPTRLLLRFPLPDKDIVIDNNQTVELTINKKTIGSFKLEDFKRESKSLFMIVESDEFREDLLNLRLVNVEIALNSQTGYLVPKKSLINREKEKGIYCTKSEEIVFKPVKVLRIKDEEAVVEGLNPTDIIVVNPDEIKKN